MLLFLQLLVALVACFYWAMLGPLTKYIPVSTFPLLCTPVWLVLVYKTVRGARRKIPSVILALCELPFVLGYPAWIAMMVLHDTLFGFHPGGR
jgi:hypothetical protein